MKRFTTLAAFTLFAACAPPPVAPVAAVAAQTQSSAAPAVLPRVIAGKTPIRTLMYRSPDGKIEEFLFNRR